MTQSTYANHPGYVAATRLDRQTRRIALACVVILIVLDLAPPVPIDGLPGALLIATMLRWCVRRQSAPEKLAGPLLTLSKLGIGFLAVLVGIAWVLAYLAAYGLFYPDFEAMRHWM
jgi:hypothetical protein